MNKVPENTIRELPGDAAIESRARAIFRSACENVDSYHALRLGMARRKALHTGTTSPASRMWAPLAGAVACCVLIVGVVWMHPERQMDPTAAEVSSAPAMASGGIDSSEEITPEIGSTRMEMVQDLDFYRWLATQPTVATSRGGGR